MDLKVLASIIIGWLCWSCSNSTHKILYIADAKADCVGVAPQKCLQIKEAGNPDGWTYFYNAIEGFDYEEGYFYKIKVAVTTVENPPADGSSLRYELIEVLGQSKAPLVLDESSWLVTRLMDMDSFGRNPFIKVDLAQNTINGNTSCNRFSAKIDVSDNKVKISEVASTEMACRDTPVENAFLEALQNVASYTLHGDKLQFLDKNKALLIECDYLKQE